MEEVLDRAGRVSDKAELYILTQDETPVTFEANHLKMLEGKQTTGVALRIIKDGRLGLASTTNMGKLKELVDSAAETAQFGAEAKFDFPYSSHFPDVKTFDPEVERLDVSSMIDAGRRIIDAIHAYDPDILCDVGIEKSTASVRIINTNGLDAQFKQSSFGIGIHGNLIRDTDMLDVYESQEASQPNLDYMKMTSRLIEKVKLAERLAAVATCRIPVIFTPKGLASTFIGPIASALNGKVVWQGASPLGQRLGQKIADERLNLHDDGTIQLRPTSRPFDDEGVPTQRTPLIENGVLKNFYYDLQTAGLAGTKSTGNGFRGLGSLPSPSLTALLFSPGDTTYDQMVKNIKEGVIVDQVMGAWAGNILAGEFSGNIHLGWKIENGEVVGRVKNAMVAGNVIDAFQNIVAIGTEAEWIGGGLKIPAMQFENIGVATKE